MEITRGKILALVGALPYLAGGVVVIGCGADAIGALGIVAIGSLILIWFPDEIGDASGPVAGGGWMTETPGVAISLLGWLFLVGGVPLVAYLLRSTHADH